MGSSAVGPAPPAESTSESPDLGRCVVPASYMESGTLRTGGSHALCLHVALRCTAACNCCMGAWLLLPHTLLRTLADTADGAAIARCSRNKDTKQYHVALLPPDGAALEQRTLADAFPKLKPGRKGGR